MRTGHRGRPRKVIDTDYLRQALDPRTGLSIRKLSRALRLHYNTVANQMRDLGIDRKFTEVSDEEIDAFIRDYRQSQTEDGVRYTIGYLRSLSLRVQRRRVIESMRRVDPIGVAMREQHTVRRRVYHVTRPNSLWHLDGHHKLIRWGFVIHGIIDGYCRTASFFFINTLCRRELIERIEQVVGLRAANSNRASTVLGLFNDAKRQHGRPSRVRGDRGGENVKVAIDMILHRGVNRASFIWGPCVNL